MIWVGAILAAYLVGGIPFGYLVARFKGVNLFKVGSGNIGASNVGRVLGRPYGVAVFVLDFAKGAIPVWLVGRLALLDDPAHTELLRVLVAATAFLGHLFPIWLGFRGGKGVATGAGTVMVLMPGPAMLAMFIWVVVTSGSLCIALGSIVAVIVLCAARLWVEAMPFGEVALPGTLYALVGTLLVVVKHHGNVRRLIAGTENRLEAKPVWLVTFRLTHLLAAGLWAGAAFFLTFLGAPSVFRAIPDTAVAGSAVAPMFGPFFALQLTCGLVVLVSAWLGRPSGRFHRCRAWLALVAYLGVIVGAALAEQVTRLRLERLSPEPAVAEAARALFGPVHGVSMLLSVFVAGMATILLACATCPPEALAGRREC